MRLQEIHASFIKGALLVGIVLIIKTSTSKTICGPWLISVVANLPVWRADLFCLSLESNEHVQICTRRPLGPRFCAFLMKLRVTHRHMEFLFIIRIFLEGINVSLTFFQCLATPRTLGARVLHLHVTILIRLRLLFMLGLVLGFCLCCFFFGFLLIISILFGSGSPSLCRLNFFFDPYPNTIITSGALLVILALLPDAQYAYLLLASVTFFQTFSELKCFTFFTCLG